MKYLLVIYLFLTYLTNGQSVKFQKELGSFSNAVSIDIDLNKNIYVADLEENTISKLDSSGNVIESIGGMGWTESTFDEPVCIITNTLSVYVADKNNNRIQRFDKDLNFLSELNGENENNGVEFAYPISMTINSIGDLFVLESDNNKILKFDLTGNFLDVIGSIDAGNFVLETPKSITSDNNGNIFVLDFKTIKVFDQYGNPKLKFDLDRTPNKIRMFNKYLIYIYDDYLEIFNFELRKIYLKFSENVKNISDAVLLNSQLFILTDKNIITYKILNN